MTEVTQNALVLTEECRFLFPNLFEKKRVKRNGKEVGEPKFSLCMLLVPGTEKKLQAAALAVAKAKWPSRDVIASIKSGDIRWPFIPGARVKASLEKKATDAGREFKGDYYDNVIVLKSDTTFDVGVIGPNKQDIVNPKDVYSGCYGYVELKASAYDGVDGGKDGLKFYLNNVMKSRDGEKIAGRTVADAFAGVQAQETGDDLSAPGGDFDDEISF